MSVENTHWGAAAIGTVLQRSKSIFFIGIGGISMSALAELTAHEGYRVGGSDRSESAITVSLRSKGIEVFIGHDAEHITSYDTVVYTVAIGEDNPDYVAARAAGKPLFSRAD